MKWEHLFLSQKTPPALLRGSSLNILFWKRFTKYFLFISTFVIIPLIAFRFLDIRIENGPDIAKAQEAVDCLEECEGFVYLDEFQNTAGGSTQGDGPAQGPVQGPVYSPSPAPPVSSPMPPASVTTNISPPVHIPTTTPHQPTIPTPTPVIHMPSPPPPSSIVIHPSPTPIAILAEVPLASVPPAVPSCPVNNSCCAPGPIVCTSNGLDERGECPEPYKWCYAGACVHRDYNPSTNLCIPAQTTPSPIPSPVVSPTPILIPTPTPITTTVTPPVPVSVSAVSNATSTSTATGGGGSANVHVTQSIPEVQGTTRTITQVSGQKVPVETKELPKTGLPLVAWGIAASIPFGIKLRNYLSNAVKSQDDKPLFISQKRKFQKGS